jgi:hypothetical protein
VAENAHGGFCSYRRSSTSSVTRLSGCARCAKAQMVFTFLSPWPVDEEDSHNENKPEGWKALKRPLERLGERKSRGQRVGASRN